LLAIDEDEWEVVNPQDRTWDVVVVGSGMGGSTMAYALAQNGYSVLVIEKGSLLHKAERVADDPPHAGTSPGSEPLGLWPHKLAFQSNLGDGQLRAFLGCGSGGSTIAYGAVLERLAPLDFHPGEYLPTASGADVPARWPVSFEEMLPYYRKAEQLFRVRGTPDPIYGIDEDSLMTPPELNSKDKAVFAHLRAKGLQPYRMHIASEFHPECEYCRGYCPKTCRNDAAKMCLIPALKTGQAKFLGNCTVTRLEASESAIDHLICERIGTTLEIKARVFVLAAGAYGSPLILLNSSSDAWPNGLANRSGMVGRNLMMHTTDFFATWPKGMGNRRDFSRAVALRDLYVADGVKLGMIQSSGVRANWGLVLQFLRDHCDRHPAWWMRLLDPCCHRWP
jgi:choline dehydrogenase-like flavoprotein